ncbi:MAG: class I SAM-dependent methyltransferase [Elusimicrobiota bacterium]
MVKDLLSHEEIIEKVKEHYRTRYENYRKIDEEIKESEHRRHFGSKINELCRCYQKSINALDIGCGTGRYFSYFHENVEKLVGIDVSMEMLEIARNNPVDKENIKVKNIELVCADIFDAEFADEEYDLICAIGVFGLKVPFNSYICNIIYQMLKREGSLFLTIMDKKSIQIKNSFSYNLAKIIATYLSPVRKIFRHKLFSFYDFYMTENEIRQVFDKSEFESIKITQYKPKVRYSIESLFEIIARKNK